MKKAKQICALLLCGAMLLTALTGCNADKERDPVKELLGYSGDTVYFTFNGEELTAGQYLFWLAQNIDSYQAYYENFGMGDIDWNEDLGGMTASDYVKQISRETLEMVYVMHVYAEREGIVLTEEDLADYEAEMAKSLEEAGGQEAYVRNLLAYCITEENIDYVNTATLLYQKVEEFYCGPGGKFEGSAAELLTYAEEIGLMQAKHILRLTADPETGEPYSAEEIEAQRLFIQDMLLQLRESDDPETLFDELMHNYSEDTGLSVYPEGYLFQPGDMQESFESTTANLEFNEISDVVESSYGYHIILRLDPTQSEGFEEQYLATWKSSRMDALIQEWIDELEITTTPEYDALHAGDFYEKLVEYRALLDEEAAAAESQEAKTEEEDDSLPEEEGLEDEEAPSEEEENSVQPGVREKALQSDDDE